MLPGPIFLKIIFCFHNNKKWVEREDVSPVAYAEDLVLLCVGDGGDVGQPDDPVRGDRVLHRGVGLRLVTKPGLNKRVGMLV